MWTIVTIAWRNLWRQGRRTLITAVAMGIGVAMSVGMYTFSDGMMRMMFTVMVDQQLGHVQVHHPDYPAKKLLHDTLHGAGERLAAVEALGVRGVSGRLFGFGLVSAGDQTEGGQVVGVDPRLEATFGVVDERLVSGRYLAPEGRGEMVIGAGLAKKLKVELGGEVVLVTQAADGSLGNALFEVVGVFRSGDAMLDRNGAQVGLADLQEMLVLPDQVHEILVLATDEAQIAALLPGVRGAVGEQESPLVQSWQQASPMTAQIMQSIEAQMGISIFLVLSLASLGVLNTMLMSVFERTRELGVLMAVGMRPRQVVGLVVSESVLLGAVASAVGMVFAAGLVWYLTTYGISFDLGDEAMEFMGVGFESVVRGHFRAQRAVTVVALVMVVSVVAALWPAWRAARLSPVDAISDR